METIARGVPLPGMAPIPGLFQQSSMSSGESETVRRRQVQGLGSEAEGNKGRDS
jgi:hypothetical protein